MAKTITISLPDEVADAFEARAKTLKSQGGGNFQSGSELILEFVEGHVTQSALEVHQQAADKVFRKEARRVRRLLHPNEDD